MSNARRSLPASYVVRLYRADPARPQAVAGLVEDLDRGVTRSFRNGTELLRQLTGAGTETGPDATCCLDAGTCPTGGIECTPDPTPARLPGAASTTDDT